MRVLPKVVARMSVIVGLGAFALNIVLICAHSLAFSGTLAGTRPGETANAGHNVQRNALVMSVNAVACNNPAAEPTAIQPITLINMVHLLARAIIR